MNGAYKHLTYFMDKYKDFVIENNERDNNCDIFFALHLITKLMLVNL